MALIARERAMDNRHPRLGVNPPGKVKAKRDLVELLGGELLGSGPGRQDLVGPPLFILLQPLPFRLEPRLLGLRVRVSPHFG